jgi:hypothetical protein
MGEKSYGRMLIEGFVKSIPWAIVFTVAALFIVNMTMNMLRQEVKEAMEFGAHMAVHQVIQEVLTDRDFNDVLLPKIKQNVKEGIEYTLTLADGMPAKLAQSRPKK